MPWFTIALSGLITLPSPAEGTAPASFQPLGNAPCRQSNRASSGSTSFQNQWEKVENQEGYYCKLWRAEVGQEVRIVVLRDSRFEVVTVRRIDRNDLLAPRRK